MASRHPVHAHRERDRRHGGQRFGNRRNRQRDAHLNDQAERRALQRSQNGHQRGHAERQPDQTSAQLIEPPLERGALLLDRPDQRPDPPDLRRRSRLHHHSDRRAPHDRRALVDDVDAVGEPRRLFELGRCVLRHRERLAGQRRFVGPQVRRLNQPRICRDAPAAVDPDEIARHNRGRIDRGQLALANHGRLRDVELQQPLHGTTRTKLGEKSNERVDDEHDGNGSRLDAIAKHEGDARGSDQQIDDHALELIGKNPKRRNRLGRLQPVRADLVEPSPGFSLVQAGSAARQPFEGGVCRKVVPGLDQGLGKSSHHCERILNAGCQHS